MEITKHINIKNRTYYLYNDLINIKDFDPKFLKIDKKSYKTLIFIALDTLQKKMNIKLIVQILFICLFIIDGFIEEKSGNKYLNINFTDSNNEMLKKYAEVWSGIKDQMEKRNNGKLEVYEKYYMKIKFNSDDNLPLNKQLKFLSVTIIVRSAFEEDGKYYPQAFLDECLYEV